MSKNKKILAVIPARGGSKGIPKKNIIKLGGKPLIAWTIEAAKKSKHVNKIVVTTEDEEIKRAGLKYGAEAPFRRPTELATDKIHAVFPILHTIEWLAENEKYHPDIVIMLLPTAPFRGPVDIDNAVDLHLKSRGKTIIGVCESDKQLLHFRYIQDQNLVSLVKTKNLNVQRQDLEKIYYVNGSIYVSDAKRLMKEKTFHTRDAAPYVMDGDRCIDINTFADLERAKFMLRLNKYGKYI